MGKARVTDEHGHVFFMDVTDIDFEHMYGAETTVKGIITDMGFSDNRSQFRQKFPATKKVIYNDPATIVLWEDGTKTIVKRQQEDTFDAMTGLALCYMKKALGNDSEIFHKKLKEGKAYD